MLKSAYTGAGLTVGHTPETDEEEEGYYLSSGWWVLWFKAGMFPKEAKAAVIGVMRRTSGSWGSIQSRKGLREPVRN